MDMKKVRERKDIDERESDVVERGRVSVRKREKREESLVERI